MKHIILSLFCAAIVMFAACSKDHSTVVPNLPGGDLDTGVKALSYPDSIFYVGGNQEDSLVLPLKSRNGRYYGFPEGIDVDAKSGAINITRSESGLKYLITFISDDDKDTLTKFVTIAGINYLDGFYNLGTADSVAKPIYNGDPGLEIPGIDNGSAFDIGDGCNKAGCNVIPTNGQINLAQSVRNGIFGSDPANNERKEFELVYRLNDGSEKATNKLKVKLYYYATSEDISPEAYDIMASRQGTFLDLNTPIPPLSVQFARAKPRPPCIFIVGR
ncbi:MAG TPA: hypothetical protein VLC28_03120 [Flavitalea sp.]|nr:hypothetical protein [Flavitalea sp.]